MRGKLATRHVILAGALFLIAILSPPQVTHTQSALPKLPAPRAKFVPGEILVRFRSEASAQSAEKQLSLTQIEGRPTQISLERFEQDNFLEGLRIAKVEPEHTLAVIEALKLRPEVAYAEPNYVRIQLATPNDPLYENLWGLHNTGVVFGSFNGMPGADIDAERAWDITTGSRDVVVGVVDGGIYVNHPDLQANGWRNPVDVSENGVDEDANGSKLRRGG